MREEHVHNVSDQERLEVETKRLSEDVPLAEFMYFFALFFKDGLFKQCILYIYSHVK